MADSADGPRHDPGEYARFEELLIDGDRDGLPDVWEIAYLGGTNATSGADDTDGDTTGPCHCDPAQSGERGVFRAIQRVFASYYNDNAYLERIRHNVVEPECGMAVLVHHSYPDEFELANGVASLAWRSASAASMPRFLAAPTPELGCQPESIRPPYSLTATAREGVAGLHCVDAKATVQAQMGLDFGGPRDIELGLRVADAADVQVELCQTRGGARLEAGAFDEAVTDWEKVRYFERI